LVSEVKNMIDPDSPVGQTGLGAGIAPIGHKVTVIAASGTVINISARFTLALGRNFSDIRADLEDIAGEYLREAAAEWADYSGLIIRCSQLESRLLSHADVIDIENLRLNNGTIGRNITLAANAVPLRGSVTHVN